MLAQIFRSGHASSTAASMRSLPVVKAPCLPWSLAISCSLLQLSSDWFDSTSKCWERRSMVSGKIARATRILGLLMMCLRLAEKDEGGENEQRYQDGHRPCHVAEEAGHANAPAL